MTRAWRGLAALLVAASLTSPATAGAQQDDGRAAVALASQTTWVGAEGRFEVRLDPVRLPRLGEDLDLVVAVRRQVRSRSAFLRSIERRGLGGRVAGEVVQPLEPTGLEPVTVALDVTGLAPGVYPVTVDVRDRRTRRSEPVLLTHLVRTGLQPVQVPLLVSWVQPVGAPPSLRPDRTRRLAEPELDALRAVVDTLGRFDDVGFDLDLVPETVRALDEGHEALLDELRQVVDGREVLTSTYVEVEPAALVQAGLATEVAEQLVRGDEALRALVGVTPTEVHRVSGPVPPAAVAQLRAAGVTGLVVEEEALAPLPTAVSGGLTVTRPFLLADDRGGSLPAVVADATLATHLESEDEVLGAHLFLADLAVLYGDLPGTERGVAVVPPRLGEASDEVLSLVLGGLRTAPMLDVRAVSTLLATVARLEAGGDEVVRDQSDLAPSTLDGRRFGAVAERLRTVLRFGDPGEDERDLLAEQLGVSLSERLRASERTALLDAVDAALSRMRAAVRVVEGRRFRLTAREGRIPLTVVNDNPFPVVVSLEVSAEKLEFPGAPGGERGRRVFGDVEVPPGQRRVVTVPVRARTSAAFPLRVVLRSADGEVLARSSLTVVSTAVSGIGIALSAAAAVFLAVWWSRHWRRARKPARATEGA